MASLNWAEAADDDEDEEREPTTPERPGDVDETFAMRRVRQWLRGTFGGGPTPPKPGERKPEQ